MPKKGEPRYDTCWRKSRIAARILLREEAGRLTQKEMLSSGVTWRTIPRSRRGSLIRLLMEYGAKNLDWSASAGQRLDLLAQKLPRLPRLEILVFGSAPLQLLIDRAFLSEDVDISPAEEAYESVAKVVEEQGWAKGQSDFYIQVCDRSVRFAPRGDGCGAQYAKNVMAICLFSPILGTCW